MRRNLLAVAAISVVLSSCSLPHVTLRQPPTAMSVSCVDAKTCFAQQSDEEKKKAERNDKLTWMAALTGFMGAVYFMTHL